MLITSIRQQIEMINVARMPLKTENLKRPFIAVCIFDGLKCLFFSEFKTDC